MKIYLHFRILQDHEMNVYEMFIDHMVIFVSKVRNNHTKVYRFEMTTNEDLIE